MNLSTSNFKKLPKAFLLFLVVVIFLESFVFSRAFILADWNTLVLLEKRKFLKEKKGADIVFFGDSLLWAVDARNLEIKLDNGQSVYNYYIANLGPSFFLSLIFKQYIRNEVPPKIIFISLMPKNLYRKTGLDFAKDYQIVMFRRFIDFTTIAENLPLTNNWNFNKRLAKDFLRLCKQYILNSFPSYNYRVLIRNAGPPFLIAGDASHEFFSLRPKLNQIAENKKLISHVRETNGQLLMPSEEAVSAEESGIEANEQPAQIPNDDIEKIIEIAKDKKIQIVFFFMPMWEKRYRALGGESYLKPAKDYLDDLSRKYSNFCYHELKTPIYSRDYFIDAAHLNRKGFKKFNREFEKEFKEIVNSMPARK